MFKRNNAVTLFVSHAAFCAALVVAFSVDWRAVDIVLRIIVFLLLFIFLLLLTIAEALIGGRRV